jgi:hypothetical protein
VELSVTDDGTFFPRGLRIRDPADKTAGTGAFGPPGRSLLVTRLWPTRGRGHLGRAAAGPRPG